MWPASTFTPSNWDTAQTVSVTGVQDDDANNETVTVSHSVSGYGSVTSAHSVMVTVTDNDTARVSVAPTTLTVSEASSGGTTTRQGVDPAVGLTHCQRGGRHTHPGSVVIRHGDRHGMSRGDAAVTADAMADGHRLVVGVIVLHTCHAHRLSRIPVGRVKVRLAGATPTAPLSPLVGVMVTLPAGRVSSTRV